MLISVWLRSMQFRNTRKPTGKHSNFKQNLQNINVGRENIGPLMWEYAGEKGLLTQPRRILISKFFAKKGKMIAPLLLFLLFCLDLWLVCKKLFFRAVHSIELFQQFLSICMVARRKGDWNSTSIFEEETRKSLAKVSYGCQIMDRNLHSVKESPSDKNTHGSASNKMFEYLGLTAG